MQSNTSPIAGVDGRWRTWVSRSRGRGVACTTALLAGVTILGGGLGAALAAPPLPPQHHPWDDVPIVRIDPHARAKPATPAARRDAAQARVDMTAQLQDIDAAALLLQHGFATRNLREIGNVKDTMDRPYERLSARVPRLHGDPWPEADDTAFSDCTDAAGTLSTLATNPTAAATVAEVAERRRNLVIFKQKEAACHVWVNPKRAARPAHR